MEFEDIILTRQQLNIESGRTPLFLVMLGGHLDAAALLIEKGADVNKANKQGLSPLHIAVMRDREDLVRLLCCAGANVHTRDKFKNTPLHLAVRLSCTKALGALFECGAADETPDQYGMCALEYMGWPEKEQLIQMYC
jgi:ankyrin repeat protein